MEQSQLYLTNVIKTDPQFLQQNSTLPQNLKHNQLLVNPSIQPNTASGFNGVNSTPLATANGLESIASAALVAINQEKQEQKDLQLKKRRSQIAAASRKTRAKRKHELSQLKLENEKLWQQNVALNNRLRALGENVPQLERPVASNTGEMSSGIYANVADMDTISVDKRKRTPTKIEQLVQTEKMKLENNISPGFIGISKEQALKLKQKLNGKEDETIAGSAKRPKIESASNSEVENFKRFFTTRLSWVFMQMKTDTLSHFGRNLSFEAKQQLASLEVALQIGTSTTDSEPQEGP